jgi:hypothetical protein
MISRSAWRFLSRLAKVLTVPDARPARPAGRLVLYSCGDVDRGMTEDGRRYSPLLAGIRDIVEELGLGSINLTHSLAVFRSAQVRDGTITLNYRSLALRVVALMLLPLGRRPAAAARERLEVRMYRRLLQSLQPVAVFSIQPPFAMSQAARQLGVKVIEAMHGTNVCLDDKIFRAHMNKPDRMLPHVVLAFDDVTHATFTTFASGHDTVALRADDPWLHACRRHRGRWHLSTAAGAAKRILVTLQWGYDGERDTLANIIPNGVIHPALDAAIEALAGRGIAVWLRLHPIQMTAPGYRHHRRIVHALAQRHAHVEYERPTALPLPLVLEQVSGHITMCSSSVGEAAAAGVPSLLLCPTLHPGGAHAGMFRELESAGHARFGTLDAEAIVDWIESLPPRTAPAEPADELQRRHRAALRFYAGLIESTGRERSMTARLDLCEAPQ